MCDLPICFSQSNVKARKAHRCVECRNIIQAGETYIRASGIWPDGPMSFKTCLICERIRSAVSRATDDPWDDCGTAFGELYSEIPEYLEPRQLLDLSPPPNIVKQLFWRLSKHLKSHEIFSVRYALIDWSKTA